MAAFLALAVFGITVNAHVTGVAANCPAGQVVVANVGTPRGVVTSVSGIDMYVTKPEGWSIGGGPKPNIGVLYLSDVLGLKLDQNLLLADSFARAGYVVVAPDMFKGKPAPDDVDRPDLGFVALDFLNSYPPNITDPVIEAAIKYLRNDLGVKRLGVSGYCFGARYGFRFATAEKKAAGVGIDVIHGAHPTFLTDDEITARVGPAALGTAQSDVLMPEERRWQVEKALLSTALPSQLVLYSGVHHGFAVRANYSDPVAKFVKESSFAQAIRWFDQWL